MDIFNILDVIESTSIRSVLATIIHVDGSAYLKEGTSMLFQEDGTQVGILSAGCIETDLAERVQQVFSEWVNKTVVYDLSSEDDLSWGQGAGCNGVLYILLEPIDDQMKKHLSVLKEQLAKRKPVLHVKELTNNFIQTKYIYLQTDGQAFGSYENDSLPSHLKMFFQNMTPFERSSGIKSSVTNSAYTYFHLYQPKPHLVIWGAGYDAKPLVFMASHTGFSITLCDWRPALCNKEQFPLADQIVTGFPNRVLPELNMTNSDFLIIMTHNFNKDKEILSFIKKQKLKYVGVLGSRERTIRLLNGDNIPRNIHSPIGILIGAKGPQEIAVSIMAEIIKQVRKPSREQIIL